MEVASVRVAMAAALLLPAVLALPAPMSLLVVAVVAVVCLVLVPPAAAALGWLGKTEVWAPVRAAWAVWAVLAAWSWVAVLGGCRQQTQAASFCPQTALQTFSWHLP